MPVNHRVTDVKWVGLKAHVSHRVTDVKWVGLKAHVNHRVIDVKWGLYLSIIG